MMTTRTNRKLLCLRLSFNRRTKVYRFKIAQGFDIKSALPVALQAFKFALNEAAHAQVVSPSTALKE
jgi:hypothetical protein